MNERASAIAATDAATAERKFLTLLFTDLSGYTRLTATRDPEEVLRAVGPLLAELQQVAAEHGGYVPSVQGDGFMSIFGVPVSHADDPRRAVAAAVAMKAVVASHRRAAPDVPEIHIGIASGEVLVRSAPHGHDVIGTAVNLAARLSDAAMPGEVLVDESVAALTAEHAVYGSARALSLHGFAGAVRAMPLEDVTSTARTVTAPLAGRTDHLLALDAALGSVRATGQSAVQLVIGEPGAGKSHLMSSWLAAHEDVLVLRGACRAYGSALPLSALSEAILASTDQDGRADFVRLLPRQRAVSTVGREPDEALHVAARAWLERFSRRRCTVLVLEDVHWADPSLLDVLRALHAEPLAGELLVLGSSRDPIPDLPQRSITALTPEEIRAVVQQRIGADPEPALLQLLHDRSGGNALWLVEFLGLLRDRGQLRIDGDTVGVVERVADTEVPATIRLLISARLDTLTAGQKLLLQRASVRPGHLDPTAWPGDVDDLAALADLGLLERSADGRLRFAHGLIREAVYRSMPRAARVREHEHVLASSDDPAVLSYAAREVQRLDVAPTDERRRLVAARALDAVTEHARHLRRSHTRAARDVLDQAADLCAELDVVAPRSAAELLIELAEVLRDLEQVERSQHAAERAVAVAEVAGDRHVALRAKLAHGEAWLGSDNARARAVAEEVLANASTAGAVRGRAWRLLSGSHAYDDLAELQRLLAEAHTSYVAAGETALAAETARALAFNLSLNADESFEHWFAVAATSTSPEHLRGQGELALVRAVVAQARGAWEESWQAAEAATGFVERAGMHQTLVTSFATAVEAATATGRRAALPGLISRLTSMVHGHRPRLQITALCAIAPAYALLGKDGEARRALEEATALLPSVGPIEQAMVRVAEGHSAALAGRHEAAETAFAHAETLTSELGFRLSHLACRLERLAAHVARGGSPGLRSELLTLADELTAAGAGPYAERARELASSLQH